jgi:ribonuclease P protein component
VCRNRIKRWIREFFRRQRARIGAAVDLSVVVKPGTLAVKHAELDLELREALKRLRVHDDA